MYGRRHPLWLLVEQPIDEGRVSMRQLIRVIASLPRRCAHLFITQIRQIGIVELHERAARVKQRSELCGVGVRHILVEGLEIRVGLVADSAAAASKMQHRGGRNRDLRRPPRHARQVTEVRELNVFTMTNLADDLDDRRRQMLPAVLTRDDGREMRLDAVQL